MWKLLRLQRTQTPKRTYGNFFRTAKTPSHAPTVIAAAIGVYLLATGIVAARAGDATTLARQRLARQEIGLGPARRIKRAEIFWPVTGVTQVVTGLEINRFYRVREGEDGPIPTELRSFRWPQPV